MEKEAEVQSLTDILAKFTAYIGKRLPTDVKDKQAELRAKETNPMAIEIFDVAKLPGHWCDSVFHPGRIVFPFAW